MLSDNIRGYVIVQLSYVMFRTQLTQIGKYAMGTQYASESQKGDARDKAPAARNERMGGALAYPKRTDLIECSSVPICILG